MNMCPYYSMYLDYNPGTNYKQPAFFKQNEHCEAKNTRV